MVKEVKLEIGTRIELSDLRDEFAIIAEGDIVAIDKSMSGNNIIITLDTGWKILVSE